LWGLGIGDAPKTQNPNPQSPIPNTQFIHVSLSVLFLYKNKD
jgi:hypothetical protein